MSGLDTRFIPLGQIQEQFWDKLENAPMAGGTISFYIDDGSSVPKEVYALTGAPSNYTFVSIGTTITLSAIGTLDDGSGNNLVPYLYPYQGVPDDNSDIVELYYIVVTNAESQFQFSVSGVPYVPSDVLPPSALSSNNYIPNGQFLLHRDFLNDGEITDTAQNVAYGGWEFIRATNSSKDYVTFPIFTDPIDNPTGNPRYACEIYCESPHSGDLPGTKVLQVKFNDVNRFADSSAEPQAYTLFFSGKSNDTNSIPVSLRVYKYFGSSGSTATTIDIDDIVITPAYQSFPRTFTFGSNSGKTVDPTNDYVSIQLVLPATLIFDISVTDFVLAVGEDTVTSFPATTNGQMQTYTFGSSLLIPNPDGSKIGLPIILTGSGFEYDDSQVGKIESCVYTTAGNNEVLCDGSNYDTSTVNSIGIPYSRIFNKTFNSTTNFSLFGTGADFFTSFICTVVTKQIMISTNSAGSCSNIAEGSIPTGFSLKNMCPGGAYSFRGNIDGSNNIIIYNTIAGAALAAVDNGTSGFTLTSTSIGSYGVNNIVITAAPSAGTYFKISNTTTTYFMWFTVDGAGTAPAPGGTPIKVDILSTHSPADIRQIVISALLGYNISDAAVLAAAGITAGSYLKIYNYANNLYYIWYEVAGSGTDPDVSGATKGIKVTLLGSETDVQVAFKTQTAINSAMWAAPDLRGMFLRGYMGSSAVTNIDPDVLSRVSYCNSLAGNNIGSVLTTQNLAHTHAISVSPMSGKADGDNDNYWQNYSTGATASTGGNQSNPINMYVNYVIKI